MRKPVGAHAIVREQPVHVAAADTAIGADRAIGPLLGDAQQRPSRALAKRLANVHLVAFKRNASFPAFTMDFVEGLLVEHAGLDVEVSETGHGRRLAFDAVRVADRRAQHLIAAA
jgi:hypothetical protein